MSKTPRRWFVVLVLAAIAAAGCGSNAPSDSESVDGGVSDTTAPETEATFATFNAGLARGFVDLAEQRVDAVVDAVAALEADVVAVQEVWEPGDVAALETAAAAAGFDTVSFLDPSPETAGEPACPAGEVDALEACARQNCADIPTDQLADCVLRSCGDEFAGLCESCQTCLAANVGQPLESVLTTCEAGADRYAYGGSFGIGILSRLPVLGHDHLVLESSLNRRAVLHALVDAGELGLVHVFATHLSPIFADVPFPGEGSWEAEQAAQIRALLDYVDETAGPGEPVVLLGDLNTGPATGESVGEAPGNFSLLTDAGFAAPYLDDPDPACTFCAANPLVGGADDDTSVLIDHVLVRDLDAAAQADRILDQPVDVTTPDGTVTTRLSDHYGVSVTFGRG